MDAHVCERVAPGNAAYVNIPPRPLATVVNPDGTIGLGPDFLACSTSWCNSICPIGVPLAAVAVVAESGNLFGRTPVPALAGAFQTCRTGFAAGFRRT